MIIHEHKKYQTQGDGQLDKQKFIHLGDNVIFENEVLVFHPEQISIKDNVYIGHRTILKGYYKNEMIIGSHTWIGQGVFIHSAGGVEIGSAVGIGPMVNILSSSHKDTNRSLPVMFNELEFKKVTIGDGSDIGTGAVILPGVTIGEGSIIGAGSVVNKSIPDFCVAAGVPAKIIRER